MDSKPADRNSWERRDDESEKAFAAFKVFLEMGEARTVRDAYRQVSGNPGASQAAGYFSEWSSKFEWFPRAADYDRHLFRAETRAVESERQKWARRRAELREDAWKDAAALRARARAILALPLTEKTETTDTLDEDGKTVHRTVVVQKPVNVKVSDAGTLLNFSDRMARLAADMETDRITVDTPEQKRARQLQTARIRFRQSAELFPEEPEDVRARTIAAAFGFPVDEITVPPQFLSDSVS
jgi:hypothetical protein